jgi:hypothetical protein
VHELCRMSSSRKFIDIFTKSSTIKVMPTGQSIWQADRPRSVTGRNSALESVPTNAESEDPGHRDIISIIDYVKSNGQMLIT